MLIYLIRHGETEANASRVVQRPDVPLSERGIAQAERLAGRLADARIARIVTSDYARAAMTAERIHRATAASLEVEPLLQERNFGDLRGRSYSEPGVGDRMMEPGFEPPGGESWGTFHERVDRAWECIERLGESPESDGALAVVTHGLVCHSITARLVELPDGVERAAPDAPVRFGNTSLTILRGPSPWRTELLACTAHLEDGEPSSERAAV